VTGGGCTTDYPFSIPPKDKLRTSYVFALYRDHYELTQFDMTQGIAAGPYGDPTRVYGSYDGSSYDISNHKLYGAWERPERSRTDKRRVLVRSGYFLHELLRTLSSESRTASVGLPDRRPTEIQP
jgi:dipeptidase